MPFVSFQDMGVMSMRLTVYTVSFLIAFSAIWLQSFFFVISWPFTKKFKLAYRFHMMMRRNYFWRGIIRLIVESYFDLCVGILISFKEPHFEKPSDIFDFGLTVFFTIVVILGPITCFFQLRKYSKELDQVWFQQSYGSLTDGYYTTGVLGTEKMRYMIVWFFVRRNLTALALVYLGDQSPVFQIAAMLYISLADLTIDLHLNAYESQFSGIMMKINDLIVFLLSYFPFLYAGGLVTDPELTYQIGWAQCALVGTMFLGNMTVLIISTISSMMQESRRVKVEQFNLRILRDYGFLIVIVVESRWQIFARLLTIDWAFFDGVPARLSQQIAPYVQLFLHPHQQAEYVADKVDYLELGFQVDNRAEQIVLNESNQVVFKQSSPAEQNVQKNSDYSFGTDIEASAIKSAAPIEYDTEPTEFDKHGQQTKEHKKWEQSMLRPHGPSARVTVSTNQIPQTEANKVMPAQKFAQTPVLLYQRKQKLIVEGTQELQKNEQATLNKLKEQVFYQILVILAAEHDPIVANHQRNLEALEGSDLLPNDFSSMSEKELKDEVRTIIAASQHTPDIKSTAKAEDVNESQLLPWDSPRQKRDYSIVLTGDQKAKQRTEALKKVQLKIEAFRNAKNADRILEKKAYDKARQDRLSQSPSRLR